MSKRNYEDSSLKFLEQGNARFVVEKEEVQHFVGVLGIKTSEHKEKVYKVVGLFESRGYELIDQNKVIKGRLQGDTVLINIQDFNSIRDGIIEVENKQEEIVNLRGINL